MRTKVANLNSSEDIGFGVDVSGDSVIGGVELHPPPERLTDALYVPALDGLRFIAFSLVFLHHLPRTIAGFAAVARVGWAGVEIFFALSSFLLFYLLSAEQKRRGEIDIPKFYWRRLLRVYPLMVLFPVLMLALFTRWEPKYYTDVTSNIFGIENFVVWIRGYSTLPYSPHLWSLSYELQMYVVIPLAFLIYRAVGRRLFFCVLIGIWIASVGARATFLFAAPEARGIIWVTPFLRPESTLVGVALALVVSDPRAKISKGLVTTILVGAAAALFLGPDISAGGAWLLVLYPISATIAGTLLWLTLHTEILGAILSHRTPRYLGKISYGLYVYHLLAIYLVLDGFRMLGIQHSPENFAYYVCWLVLALALTIVMAAVSYRFVESPFLRWKSHFELVKSRPI